MRVVRRRSAHTANCRGRTPVTPRPSLTPGFAARPRPRRSCDCPAAVDRCAVSAPQHEPLGGVEARAGCGAPPGLDCCRRVDLRGGWSRHVRRRLRTRLGDVQERLVDAENRLQDSEQRLQAATRETTAVRANLALLTAADVVELRLAGQPPAPAARARAFLSRARGVLFAATSLPAIRRTVLISCGT